MSRELYFNLSVRYSDEPGWGPHRYKIPTVVFIDGVRTVQEWEYNTELHEALKPVMKDVAQILMGDDSVRDRSTGGQVIAEEYVTDKFIIRDYCWCMGTTHPLGEYDANPTCPPNFEHFATGIKANWKRYFGCDLTFNREPQPGEAEALMLDCMSELGTAGELLQSNSIDRLRFTNLKPKAYPWMPKKFSRSSSPLSQPL